MNDSTPPTSAHAALESLRKRLLDLTSRNPLINFRHTKGGSLRIIDELPDQLAETLLAETEMRFLPVSEPSREQIIAAGYLALDPKTGQEIRLKKDPSAAEWARLSGLDASYEVPSKVKSETGQKHADTAIQTLLFPHEMETRLRSLRQKTQSAIEETGANILYLAFGFLEWTESSDPETRRIAPLFLMPMRLEKGHLNRRTGIYEYSLSYSGEDIVSNLSLREKLRVDFSLALPELDENTQPESYFEAVRRLIADIHPDWCVRRYITLTLLNFSKLLMYLDLDAIRWPEDKQITGHPVVSRFLEGYHNENPHNASMDPAAFQTEYVIDDLEDAHKKYPLIYDADSSQHSALVDAVDGKNLIIEGPPGTGKSQTITNLIAAMIAQGKKVLFVAEKLAALEVVKRRLDAAGLGEFCLELHSHKSQKRRVLDEINTRLIKNGRYAIPRGIKVEINRYEELKTALKDHADRINQDWKGTATSLHDIFMAATRYRETLGDINPADLHPEGVDGDTFDPAYQRRTQDLVIAFGDAYQNVLRQLDGTLSLRQHPWYGVQNGNLQLFDFERVAGLLEEWQGALERLISYTADVAQGLDCRVSDLPEELSGLAKLVEDLSGLPMPRGNELLALLPRLTGERITAVTNFLSDLKTIQEGYEVLNRTISRQVLGDISGVDKVIEKSHYIADHVAGYVSLSELERALSDVAELQEQLDEIERIIADIQAVIAPHGTEHINYSEAGLKELTCFIETAAALAPAYWKLRSACFDTDELDDILDDIASRMAALRKKEAVLIPCFNSEALPEVPVLMHAQAQLSRGGLFCWFKSGWRRARKTMLACAASPEVSLREMMPLLDTALAYKTELDQFKNQHGYAQLLGEYFRGMDTDITMLKEVRKWYQLVRRTYGIGFGSKVGLGDTLIGLPDAEAGGLRALSQRGISKQIGMIFSAVKKAADTFAPAAEHYDGQLSLIGEKSVLQTLKSGLESALRECKPAVQDISITVNELLKRIGALAELRQRLETWNGVDGVCRDFKDQLGLQTGLDIDNSVALDAAYNTLSVAEYLDQDFISDRIRNKIYTQPEKKTFEHLRELAKQLNRLLEAQKSSYTAFETMVDLEPDEWFGMGADHIQKMVRRNDTALKNLPYLENWLGYVRVKNRLGDTGYTALVSAIERGEIPVDNVEAAFNAGIYDLLAREILTEYPDLAQFSGHNQETLRSRFKTYDEKLKTLQGEIIAYKVDAAEIPAGRSGGRVSEYSERALLEHECGKKIRHIPIRQLLKRAGNALSSLKPCFMMGPMSVAHYLEPGQIDFDVVIMDEASQIKPEDALGTIARGKQFIIVGDPKQLPPTSFFRRTMENDDDDLTVMEDSESILDATLPMFTTRRLRWHYRSQHESLIAFSNQSFYDGNLVVFPSSQKTSDEYGIHYKKIEQGCFVNRRNPEEARAISIAVHRHFKYRSEESLGIVAMSAEQRDQIERAVEMLAKDDVEFQKMLDDNAAGQEPLFIKNLENVQGDERDVIFISMTYGPKEPGGKVYQRFGPINSAVGWRRLNVLFTRSRKRMHIFSSMQAEDIVTGPHAKRGVTALRDFLAYARHMQEARKDTQMPVEMRSDFEIAVADALKKEGFDCIPKVGVAGFFIDIAVVDPGNSGRYLMGIECDGAMYHCAKSVRDRDRLRQEILERLGWRIRRIWAVDWYKHPYAELTSVLKDLRCMQTTRPVDTTPDLVIDTAAKSLPLIDTIVADSSSGLTEKLIRLDREIIRPEFPDTPENKRLLRPAMLEAFEEYLPAGMSEYRELIPFYLRNAIAEEEMRFLENVFWIVNTELDRRATASETGA